ncbi:hypothetical protein BVC80_205g66 [Macleaya cordata]|uniref:Uncharacterized protein n=1 Tax=Macleaya cordata TaxID=56857 RepID=A0A200PZ09_MACCD|nr:hypothetical protein BVC80_205g66 [Macleaya cordata]
MEKFPQLYKISKAKKATIAEVVTDGNGISLYSRVEMIFPASLQKGMLSLLKNATLRQLSLVCGKKCNTNRRQPS